MAWDEELAQLLREDLLSEPVIEKKMFGGLALLLNGHMVCVIHKAGAMFRVGKPNESVALAIDGAKPMMFTGKPMSGMIDFSDAAMADDQRRRQIMTLALNFVKSLPPK